MCVLYTVLYTVDLCLRFLGNICNYVLRTCTLYTVQLKVILFLNLNFYRRCSNRQISIIIRVNCCSMEVS